MPGARRRRFRAWVHPGGWGAVAAGLAQPPTSSILACLLLTALPCLACSLVPSLGSQLSGSASCPPPPSTPSTATADPRQPEGRGQQPRGVGPQVPHPAELHEAGLRSAAVGCGAAGAACTRRAPLWHPAAPAQPCAGRCPTLLLLAPADVDIVFLQNPFEHLVRDSDVEGMSDGWDPGTACEQGAAPPLRAARPLRSKLKLGGPLRRSLLAVFERTPSPPT